MRNGPLRQAAKAIRGAARILAACHVRPDGDALGSLLALGLACEGLGKQVRMVSPDGVPELYRFLPDWERILPTVEGVFDLAVGLDADGAHRLGGAEAAVLAAPYVIDMDHHTGQQPFGHLKIVEPRAAATGELIYGLLLELGVALSPDIAVCLQTALLTDTGGFRYSSVTPRTLEIAARLVERGALPAPIYEAVYEQKPFAATLLAGRALAAARSELQGQLVWAALARQDFTAAGAADEHTEGIVTELRATAGCRVAILFSEAVDGTVRASLRSRDGVDVAELARRFGGGGHQAAAGCSLPGPLLRAADRMVRAAVAALRHAPNAAADADASP